MAISAAVHPQRWHCLHTAARITCLRRRCITHLQTLDRTRAISSASVEPGKSINSDLQQTVPGSMVQDKITLTSEERALFDILLAATHFAGTNTVLRAAGGWVRDKLLGKESKDIDIALDNMLGKDFADKVNEYLASQGKETHKAAVIQSNPEQSKHLETARMKVNSLWIDLVNLRSETYAEGSRIPKMEFGTPLQDAMRRDFTINSLFYNLNEDIIEDFTGKGLQDLRDGILRTPLPPSETFKDDPLRVLRAVRFATRFGFAPDAAILSAAASDEVRLALGSKVSRERIGTELEGMFNGAAPTAAVRLLHQLNLIDQVFTPPPQLQQLLISDFGGPCVEVMAAAEALLKALNPELTPEDKRLLLLAALLLPLRVLSYPVKANKQQPASAHIIRESLKWRTKEVEGVALLHAQVTNLAEAYSAINAAGAVNSTPEQVRIQLGRAIRQLKAQWKLGVVLVPLLQLPAAAPLGVETGSAEASPSSGTAAAAAVGHDPGSQQGPDSTEQHVEEVRGLFSAAAAFGLEDCWQWKPLLDGKQLMDTLKLPKGPALGQATAAVMDWQLAHPQGSKEECIEHMKAVHAELQP